MGDTEGWDQEWEVLAEGEWGSMSSVTTGRHDAPEHPELQPLWAGLVHGWEVGLGRYLVLLWVGILSDSTDAPLSGFILSSSSWG